MNARAVDTIDLSSPDSFGQGFPHDWFRHLRRRDPVHWHAGGVHGGPGFWVISKYEDVRWVSRRTDVFVSRFGEVLQDADPVPLRHGARSIIRMDPPEHSRRRGLLSGDFTPRAVERLESQVRGWARTLLDAIPEEGECDLAVEVFSKLALHVIGDLLGVPLDDRERLSLWVHQMALCEDSQYRLRPSETSGSLNMSLYALDLGRERSRRPRGDLVTSLVTREVAGGRLTELEASSFFQTLAAGGIETSRNVMAHGLRLLIEHPGQLERVSRDRALVPGAVEEMLRYQPPFMYFRRTAAQDVELRGARIRAGDKVTLWYPSANRDADVFADADTFDVLRHPNDHVTFGHGEHLCLGIHLARLELRVIFEELLGRFTGFSLVRPPTRVRSGFIDGVKAMPVRYSRKK